VLVIRGSIERMAIPRRSARHRFRRSISVVSTAVILRDRTLRPGLAIPTAFGAEYRVDRPVSGPARAVELIPKFRRQRNWGQVRRAAR